MNSRTSVSKAIWIGLLVVNGPVLPLLCGPMLVLTLLEERGIVPRSYNWLIFPLLIAGAVLAWRWCFFSAAKWRLWAYQRVMDLDSLKDRAETFGLHWPQENPFGRNGVDLRALKSRRRELEKLFEAELDAQTNGSADSRKKPDWLTAFVRKRNMGYFGRLLLNLTGRAKSRLPDQMTILGADVKLVKKVRSRSDQGQEALFIRFVEGQHACILDWRATGADVYEGILPLISADEKRLLPSEDALPAEASKAIATIDAALRASGRALIQTESLGDFSFLILVPLNKEHEFIQCAGPWLIRGNA